MMAVSPGVDMQVTEAVQVVGPVDPETVSADPQVEGEALPQVEAEMMEVMEMVSASPMASGSVVAAVSVALGRGGRRKEEAGDQEAGAEKRPAHRQVGMEV